ncbi:MAG: hypothetical protein GDA50_02955 [Alphaproteobacteria bacterium GM202ARS2]|nr:hypothetical protein [Alphaproteobacteria bacterium GM202ARS2]
MAEKRTRMREQRFWVGAILVLVSGNSAWAESVDAYDSYGVVIEDDAASAVDDYGYDIVIDGESSSDPLSSMRGMAREGRNQKAWYDDWSQYVFGTSGSSYQQGSGYRRESASVLLGFEVPFSDGRVYMSGYHSYSGVEFERTLLGPITLNLAEENVHIPPQRARFSDVDTDFADAFVQYDISGVVFVVGRRRVIWGQFDLISPLNLVLPLTTQQPLPVSDKINFVVPQDGVSVGFFLGERWNIEAHYFHRIRVDPLLSLAAGSSSDVVYAPLEGNEEITVLSLRPAKEDDIESHHQYAVRVLYYGERGTFGLTYYDGRIGFEYGGGGQIQVDTIGDDVIYNVERSIDLPRVQQVAFEAAVPMGVWIWKMEAVYQKTSVHFPAFSYSSRDTILNVFWGEQLPLYIEYLEEALQHNGGRLYVEARQMYLGIGVDARLSSFDVNCVISFSLTDLGSSGTRLLRLSNRALGLEQDRFDVVPIIHLGYRFGDEDRYQVGVTGGLVGLAEGVAAYFSATIGDNWTVTVGIDSLKYLSDGFLNESQGVDTFHYGIFRRSTDREYGARTSLVYRF